jgi:hypothetical protein
MPILQIENKLIFDFEKISEIHDQDRQNALYYLNYKTSDKDSEKRYLFGDIIYSGYIDKTGVLQENGNYRMEKENKKSSFFRCEDNASKMDVPFIHLFRNEFRKNVERIETILKSEKSVVLHFDFIGKSWFEIEGIIHKIDENIVSDFVISTDKSDKFILEKYLYKTLGGATPGFTDESKYKNKVFSKEEIINLMYAVGVYQKPLIRINNVGIIALPHSEKLNAEHIVDFFSRNNNKDEILEEELKEENIKANLNEVLEQDSDDLFTELIINNLEDTVKFDIVFSSIPKSPAGVFSDLIELANIEKSSLVQIHKKIREIAISISKEANAKFPNAKKPFRYYLKNSFLKIVGDDTKEKKKFQFHLLKILPQIYTDTYFQDPVLLPLFIEKVEHNIRQNGQGFTTLKYDFYFLMKVQKNNNLMKITETQSYLLGRNLGKMAQPFSGQSSPIKSFEKSYVGNLSRRIATINDLVKFSNFINEKLVIHEKLYNKVKNAYMELTEILKNFDEKYSKNNCALGFFESYYYFENNQITGETENINQ